MTDLQCRHCGDTIRKINFALGPEWMHVDPSASFPTTGKGTAWRTCRAQTVATPPDPCFCASVPNIGGGGCGHERCPVGPRTRPGEPTSGSGAS